MDHLFFLEAMITVSLNNIMAVAVIYFANLIVLSTNWYIMIIFRK